MDERLSCCQACLSSDRKLYPINKLQAELQEISFWELSSLLGGICWECHRTITKLSRFKLQVRHAQELLWQTNKIEELKPLTKLAVTTNVESQQYHFIYDPLTPKDVEIKVKLEKLDDKCHSPIYSDAETLQNEEELLDEIKTYEIKPSTSDIYVDILNSVKIRKKKKKRLKKKIGKDSEEEVKQKFTTVVFTEEEMVRNREEKRSQPNFKKIPFKCDSCVLGFTRKDTFDLHMEKKHDEQNGNYICSVCQVRFTTQQQADRHKTKHYKCYRCKLCKYETLELWSAFSHCRTKHTVDQVERIHCSYCDLVAKTKHTVDHVERMHCSYCDVIVKTPEELLQHTTAEHSVYCNECGEKFKGLSTLKSHIRRIHKVKREFICDMCTKTFKTKSRLESHMVNHNSTIAQKLAYCGLCQIQYKNIYVYRNHLRTSANHAEQAYQCVDCDKRFASKVYWKKHYNFYHLHKSQFRCDLCNKLFISDWRLKNHRQTQHGVSRTRDHHCNVCGKQFFTLSTLKGHQLTHSEQRSFMCEDCGDTFKQRPALYTHCKLVHRGLKRRPKVT